MAHAGDGVELSPWDLAPQIVRSGHRDQGVSLAMNHLGGRHDVRQQPAAVAVSGNRQHLAGGTVGSPGAAHHQLKPCPLALRIRPIARAANAVDQAFQMRHHVSHGRTARALEQGLAHGHAGLRQLAGARGGHDQRQTLDPLGVKDRQMLGDHAAHGRPANMGARHAQGIEHA